MGKNFNGTQINQSPTISEKAGADVADIRNLILKYDTDGNVVVAADGTAPLLGVSIIESGYNDISGVEAAKDNRIRNYNGRYPYSGICTEASEYCVYDKSRKQNDCKEAGISHL